MTLSLCSVRKFEPRPQKTQILSPQPYCSSPPSDNAHKLVQQQISLFLEAKIVLCPSIIEEVVPVGCNVLHGGRRGRSLARQSPLHSLASQGHRVSTWGAKVRVRRRAVLLLLVALPRVVLLLIALPRVLLLLVALSRVALLLVALPITATSSPIQPPPPGTLATQHRCGHVLRSETLVWASCGLQMQIISIIHHIFVPLVKLLTPQEIAVLLLGNL